MLLAAADTFRAAAEEQLEIWAERAGADFVGSPRGGDPAAVAYDAIESHRRRRERHIHPCPIPGETQHPTRRWVVERTFSWLAKRRSIRTRWAKKAANWLALLQFACSHILLNLAFSG